MFAPPDIAEGFERFKLNCGPASLAALVGVPVLSVRHLFPDFPAKPWTTPTLARAALNKLGYTTTEQPIESLSFGLVLVQWVGSWMDPGVPPAVAYRYTHWIAAIGGDVYDINIGEWVKRTEWEADVAPRLMLGATNNRATGWAYKKAFQATRGTEWKATECGCGGCNICGFTGLAKRPPPPPQPTLDAEPPPPVKRAAKPKKPSLFDGAE